MKQVTVTILNWKKYNPRKDIKAPSWFALSNRLVEDPDFYDFNAFEFKAWIYLLSTASIKRNATILVQLGHAERICSIPKKDMVSAIEKLERIKAVTVGDTLPERERDGNVTAQYNTIQDNTIQDNTIQNNTEQDSGTQSDKSDPHILIKIWNTYCGKLPKVKSEGTSRKKAINARWRENPSEQFWVDVVLKINESDFLKGKNERGWTANFDWLMKPDIANKILEGVYFRQSQTRNSFVVPD